MSNKQAIQSYRDLEVWQRGVQLVELVYALTDLFPQQEQYELTSQLRRAAVSVPSNIAEGWGYSSSAQYVHFLERARSSLLEIETQVILAERLGYISESKKDHLLTKTTAESKMLLSLMRSLQS